MAKRKNKQLRADFRKNRTSRARQGDLTRKFQTEDVADDAARDERLSGKGELTRKRTVRGLQTSDDSGLSVLLDVDESTCLHGRVLAVHGLTSTVVADDGTSYQCAVRRLLKTLHTDLRHVVAAGDRVLFRPADTSTGIIERIEPRRGVLCRESRGRKHVLVANVDQLVIVASAAEPYLKPNLIDRFLVSAEQGHLKAVICINKVDLVDLAALQPLVGIYSQMGYMVLLASAHTGMGVDRLRQTLAGKQTVIAGQSGVGKSSLLNAVQPGLGLAVSKVSAETQKGRHTTTTARLIPLDGVGYVVDTPGIRQFQLWDVIPAEVAGLYRDLRPLVSLCAFPDCTHNHESGCAVKDAVADGWLDARRYESYLHLFAGETA
ncbi:MAG TPA: ribosome small subunit-dependent GTPase A [Pirellulales bacterium]|nr:ribosome small subunit-dependent GTPase A [Pirellulales bacterium]